MSDATNKKWAEAHRFISETQHNRRSTLALLPLVSACGADPRYSQRASSVAAKNFATATYNAYAAYFAYVKP